MLDSLKDRCPTIVFVAHKGPLEPQAALLAASLSDFYLPGKIVCRTVEPAAHWGALDPALSAEGEVFPIVDGKPTFRPSAGSSATARGCSSVAQKVVLKAESSALTKVVQKELH